MAVGYRGSTQVFGRSQTRIENVRWKDLLNLSNVEVIHELSLSLPWLAASWFAAAHGYYALALVASFMFFLTGLRQVHNAYHYALGISREATEWVMFVLSVLMLGSMHAVQLTHLLHHRRCLTEDDVEAMSARMPGWRAVLVTYDMFYHVEHHLFPAVPTCKLPVLARRLDVAAPELASKKVF